MPTVKPRITITLTDHQHAVLSALAHAQKVSMSSIVVDLVDTTLPVLSRLASILKNAAEAPQSVLDELKRSVESAEVHAVAAHQTVMADFEQLLETSAPQTHRRRASAAGADWGADVVALAEKPPTSNRGVRISSPASKIGSISPMKSGEKNERAKK